jgi:transposase-like protein
MVTRKILTLQTKLDIAKDYYTSTDSQLKVAARHDITVTTLKRIITIYNTEELYNAQGK